jgi:hypothetical protein
MPPSSIAYTGSLIIYKAYYVRTFLLLQETANENRFLAIPFTFPRSANMTYLHQHWWENKATNIVVSANIHWTNRRPQEYLGRHMHASERQLQVWTPRKMTAPNLIYKYHHRLQQHDSDTETLLASNNWPMPLSTMHCIHRSLKIQRSTPASSGNGRTKTEF